MTKTLNNYQKPRPIELPPTEIEELRRRLQEAEETIEAIRSGAVDALVVEETGGHRVYTLEGAERPYRLFVEEMQQGAATLHADGTVAWSNLQLAELLKVPQEKLVGAKLHQFVAPESIAVYDNLLWQGQTRSGRSEAHLLVPNGGRVPVFLTFNTLPKDCGAAIGVLVTDLTTQRHHDQLTAAHTALSRAEKELREFLENASVAMHWVGPGGIILWANQAELNLLCYTREEYIGRNIREFHADAPVIEDILCRLTNGDTLRDCEARLRRKDGAICHVLIDSSVLFEDGKFIHTRCFTRDVTERKQAEEALRRAMEFDEAVMANMGEGLYTVDAEGLLTSMNPAAETLFGWSFEELRGRKMHAMTHHHHRDGSPFPADECAGLQVLKEGRTLVNHEDVFLRKDGTFFDVVFSSSPLRTGDEITGLVVVFRDVSARKQVEERLRASEQRFRLMADAVPVLIWVSDVTKGCTWFNQCWRDFSGRPLEELLGAGWTKDVHPDDVDHCLNIYSTHFDARKPFSMEYRLKRHDGEYRWMLDNGIPHFEAKGVFAGYIGACVDITERKQANEQLASRARQLDTLVEQRTAKLRETIGELEAFSYSITHDLRAPLRAMQGFARMVQEDYSASLDDTGRDYLRRIATSADRMDKLIQDVLQYSRALRMDLKLAPVDVTRLLRGMLESYPDFQKPRADVAIERKLPPALGNEAALTQCFSNLLTNAIKFVPANTRPRVRISAESNGDFVRYWVADNGIGIERRHWGRIYGMFQRLETKYEGTGIGLSIVRKAVERMGGACGVESEPGVGSRFWIELKAAGTAGKANQPSHEPSETIRNL